MSFPIRTTIAAIALASAVTFAQAQTTPDQDHTVHHPDSPAAAPAQRPAVRTPGQRAMPPGGQQQMMTGGDMSQMKPMMQMMQMMRGMTMHAGMPMMGGAGRMSPFEHIEGQIAFYRAELKVTDAQAPLWNAFADVLRSGAKAMQEAYTRASAGGTPGTIIEQIDRRSALLAAQLDALKAMAAAGKPLYAVLSDEQKKLADELLAEHFRMM
jgi:hypothetical protein